MIRLAAVVVGGLATAALFGSTGIAWADSAPDITGQKYSDAQGTLSDGGFTPVVSTTVGDREAWPDCVVTNAVERTVQPPENSGGSATNDVLVSLNCDASVASNKEPGNSAASPAGAAALAQQKEQAKEDAAKSSG